MRPDTKEAADQPSNPPPDVKGYVHVRARRPALLSSRRSYRLVGERERRGRNFESERFPQP